MLTPHGESTAVKARAFHRRPKEPDLRFTNSAPRLDPCRKRVAAEGSQGGSFQAPQPAPGPDGPFPSQGGIAVIFQPPLHHPKREVLLGTRTPPRTPGLYGKVRKPNEGSYGSLYGVPITMLGSSVPLSILLAQTCIGWLDTTRI